jgi:predicted Rossmann fold nucleotide-binding protein DprA/Smf involved in DNA uptake
MIRLAVIGNKNFNDYEFVARKLDNEREIGVIVSGGAMGVDALAKRFAKEKGIPFHEFPPDYQKDGSLAKIKRNRLIVEHCDKIIAFYDGTCASTHYTSDYARKMGVETEIVSLKIR